MRGQLEQEDLQLYFNAAYQNKLRQLLETRTDYASALEQERGELRKRSEQGFLRQQQNLDLSLEENLQRTAYERQLASETRRQVQSRDESERQARSQQIGAGAGAGGAIVGGIVGGIAGGPAGVAIGSSIGSQIGQTGAQASKDRY